MVSGDDTKRGRQWGLNDRVNREDGGGGVLSPLGLSGWICILLLRCPGSQRAQLTLMLSWHARITYSNNLCFVQLWFCACVQLCTCGNPERDEAGRRRLSAPIRWDSSIYYNWQHSWLQCSPAAEWKIPAMTEHGAKSECVCESKRGGWIEGAGLVSKQLARDWLAEKLPLWDHSPHNSFHPHGGLHEKRPALPTSN